MALSIVRWNQKSNLGFLATYLLYYPHFGRRMTLFLLEESASYHHSTPNPAQWQRIDKSVKKRKTFARRTC